MGLCNWLLISYLKISMLTKMKFVVLVAPFIGDFCAMNALDMIYVSTVRTHIPTSFP